MPGLGLDGLQGHARFAEPREAGVAELVAGESRQPGPGAGAGDDLVHPGRGQRLTAARSLQHDEHAVR